MVFDNRVCSQGTGMAENRQELASCGESGLVGSRRCLEGRTSDFFSNQVVGSSAWSTRAEWGEK